MITTRHRRLVKCRKVIETTHLNPADSRNIVAQLVNLWQVVRLDDVLPVDARLSDLLDCQMYHSCLPQLTEALEVTNQHIKKDTLPPLNRLPLNDLTFDQFLSDGNNGEISLTLYFKRLKAGLLHHQVLLRQDPESFGYQRQSELIYHDIIALLRALVYVRPSAPGDRYRLIRKR